MARLIKHDAQQPHMIELGGEKAAVCACGLSQNKPYCDGSHKVTQGEDDGAVYRYEGDTKDGERRQVDDA